MSIWLYLWPIDIKLSCSGSFGHVLLIFKTRDQIYYIKQILDTPHYDYAHHKLRWSCHRWFTLFLSSSVRGWLVLLRSISSIIYFHPWRHRLCIKLQLHILNFTKTVLVSNFLKCVHCVAMILTSYAVSSLTCKKNNWKFTMRIDQPIIDGFDGLKIFFLH